MSEAIWAVLVEVRWWRIVTVVRAMMSVNAVALYNFARANDLRGSLTAFRMTEI